jgi:hypothetical protein
MIGTLPSCQAPSKKVQVCEKSIGAAVCAIAAIQAERPRGAADTAVPLPELLRISFRAAPRDYWNDARRPMPPRTRLPYPIFFDSNFNQLAPPH